jgi:hypothetical protein
VIAGESPGRASELAGIVPVEELADCSPLLGTGHNRIANFEQGRRLRAPQAARGETASGLKMKIKPRRVNVFTAVGKPHCDVRLVRRLSKPLKTQQIDDFSSV